MLTLGSSNIQFHNFGSNTDTLIIRLSDDIRRPNALRENEAFLIHPEQIIPTGFKLYLLLDKDKRRFSDLPPNTPLVILPGEYNYLGSGDIVRLSPEKNAIRVLYRRKSKHNSFLTTERCNNYCLMCSQPPRNVEDTWIVNEILQSIPLINVDTKELGFTGGEPTLLGEDLIRILNMCKSWLPHTGIHILSNGRNFANPEFTEKYAAVKHPDLMVGIPLYSDLSTIHDYVVQADGAYDETIRGILNLKRLGQKVEIRVVLHKQTYNRLPQLAEFIVRNLLFVDHIALMGLEMMGFTKANIDDLWVDPYDYQNELQKAVEILVAYRMNVSIYNLPLCILKPSLWPYARKSISDWKNEYMPECKPCSQKDKCGGFFSSATFKYSSNIRPFLITSQFEN